MKKLALFLSVAALMICAPLAHADSVSREPVITVKVTPVMSTFATPYSANDQLGGVQTLTNVSLDSTSGVTLYDVAVVDLDKQKVAIDIFFFDKLPVPTSVDNGAFTITAADAGNLVGHAVIATTDYKDSAAQSIASVGNIWKLFNPAKTSSASGVSSRNLYTIAVTRGTPTFTAANRLTFVYKFLQN